MTMFLALATMPLRVENNTRNPLNALSPALARADTKQSPIRHLYSEYMNMGTRDNGESAGREPPPPPITRNHRGHLALEWHDPGTCVEGAKRIYFGPHHGIAQPYGRLPVLQQERRPPCKRPHLLSKLGGSRDQGKIPQLCRPSFVMRGCVR